MRRITTFVVALGLVGAFAFSNPATSGPAFNNKYDSTSSVDECTDNTGAVIGTVTYNGPLYLWPPNHKEQPIEIVAADVDDPEADNDTVALAVEIAHDEVGDDGQEQNGTGNTPVDSTTMGGDAAEDSTTVTGYVRSERAGGGDGRVYTMNYQADFSDGLEDPEAYGDVACAGSFEVSVPHDMRGGAGWKHDTDGDGDGDNGNGKNDRNG